RVLARFPAREVRSAVASDGSLPGSCRTLRRLVLCVAALVAPGCSYGITVRQASAPGPFDAWRASAVESDDLSPRTQQPLRRYDLAGVHQRHPTDAQARLHQLAVADPQPDLVFALAEICYLLGRQTERSEHCEAVVYYYLSAGYAYHYLFDAPVRPGDVPAGPSDSAFDPR